MSIRLSLEIPKKHLPDLVLLTDLDFALAHKVLEDEEYASFFYDRPPARELILDNSMHENEGHPLSVAELEEAAKRCRADYVVAPDQLGELMKNYNWFKETHRVLGDRFKVAVVLSGNDPTERSAFIGNIRHASMICLPYREPRLSWLNEHYSEIMTWFGRIHLLGVSTKEELLSFADVARNWTINMSVDTTKPVKFGYMRKTIDRVPTLRGTAAQSKALLDWSLDEAQLSTTFYNIAYLRTWLL